MPRLGGTQFEDSPIVALESRTNLGRNFLIAMAKEKSTEKEERKKETKVSKEKRSAKDGVHKSKKDKKEKTAAAAEDVEVTTKLLNALESQKPGSVAVKDEGELQVKIKAVPLIGALVPFANPLADEKVGKKLLKSVKKGTLSRPSLSPDANTIARQLPNRRRSSAVSKRSSRQFENPPQPHPVMHLTVSLSSPQISRRWTSYLISLFCARITRFPTFSLPQGRSWGQQEVRRGPPVWS